MKEVRDALREAKELVADNWGQGKGFCPPRGGHCVLTALGKAAGPCSLTFEAADRLLVDITGSDFMGEWNDKPGRTQAEVVALFDKAILSLPVEEGVAA